MQGHAAVAAMLLVAACFDPHPKAGATCAAGNRCPDGLGCIDGKCVDGFGLPGDAPSDQLVPIDQSLEGCPSPYVQMPEGCYRVVATPRDWLAAEQDCESDGGHLIVVDDVPEHSKLHSLVANFTATDTWVGYTDRVDEVSFRWVTSQGGLNPDNNQCFWPSGHPNPVDDDCVVQARANNCPDWRVTKCTSLFPYVCERDGRPGDPNRY